MNDKEKTQGTVEQRTRLVNIKELSRQTTLSVSTIRKHSMDPTCPVVRFEGMRRVAYDVDRYLEWLKAGGAKRAGERRKG